MNTLEDIGNGFTEYPFVGLRSFRKDEADIFFGRQEQIVSLLERLEAHRFLAVVGSSGSGKSSLVRAGLIPALEAGIMASAGPRWFSASMRPGKNPIDNLARSILECPLIAPSWRKYSNAAELMGAVLRRGPNGIAEVLQESRIDDSTNLLILVDQFEEIFRFHHHGDKNASVDFVELLLHATKQTAQRIYVVLTMRSDFWGDCALFRDLPEAINQGQYLVPRLSRSQCREAIVGPAAAFGIEVEDELIAQLLNDMHGDSDQLPLLQHALMRLWRQQQNADNNSKAVFTLAAYEALGGIDHALSRHADEVYARLSPREQLIAETLFRGLTERGEGQRDTRRPKSLGALKEVVAEKLAASGGQHSQSVTTAPAPDLAAEVLNVLNVFRGADCSFLMPSQPVLLDTNTIIDISHESLIRRWVRLGEWVEAEHNCGQVYKRMRESAILWKSGKAALWRTPDLEIGLALRASGDLGPAWAERYGGQFDITIEFLEQSAQEQERQQQLSQAQIKRELALTKAAAQRLRLFLATACVMCLIAVSAALFGYASWSRQQALRELAESSQQLVTTQLELTESARRSTAEALGQLRAIATLISSVFSDIDPYSATSDIQLRAQLVKRLADAAEQLKDISGASSSTTDLLDMQLKLATAMLRLGEEQQATTILKRTLQAAENPSLDNSAIIVDCRNQLLLCDPDLKNRSAAIAFAEDTHRLAVTALGDEHPLTLASLHNYAYVLERAKRYYQAREINEKVLAARTKLLGPDHFETIQSMKSLASNFEHLLLLEKAVELYEDAMQRRARALKADPNEHFDLLYCDLMSSLAGCYSGWSWDQKALPIEKQLIEIYRKNLGEDHALTIQCYKRLSENYLMRREFDSALEFANKISESQLRRFGKSSPQYWTARKTTALIYYRMGEYQQSFQEYHSVYEDQKKQLGEYNLNTLATLCDAISVAGHTEGNDSFPDIETVIKDCIAVHGEDSPATRYLRSRSEPGKDIYRMQAEAQQVYGMDICPTNIALRKASEKFPKASCSFISRFDKSVDSINDGIIDFRLSNGNRWTAYQSPNAKDWVEIDFGQEQEFCVAVLYFYEDTGVQPPIAFDVQVEVDNVWTSVPDQVKTPAAPTSNVPNVVRFKRVRAQKLRVEFEHAAEVRSGITELFVSNSDDDQLIIRSPEEVKRYGEELLDRIATSQDYQPTIADDAQMWTDIYRRNNMKEAALTVVKAQVKYLEKHQRVDDLSELLYQEFKLQYELSEVVDSRATLLKIIEVLQAQDPKSPQIPVYQSMVLVADATIGAEPEKVIAQLNDGWLKDQDAVHGTRGTAGRLDDVSYNLICASAQFANRFQSGEEKWRTVAAAMRQKAVDALVRALESNRVDRNFVLEDADLASLLSEPQVQKLFR